MADTADRRRDSVVDDLVSELHLFEQLLSQAFAVGGRLQAAAVAAKADENLSMRCVHQIFAGIGGANCQIGEAMTRSAEAHRALELLGKRLGYDVTAFGDEKKPPAPGFVGGDASDRSIAA